MATDREPWLINPSVERVDEYCEMLDGLAGATEGTHPNFAEMSLRVVLTKAFHDGVRAGRSAALAEAAGIAGDVPDDQERLAEDAGFEWCDMCSCAQDGRGFVRHDIARRIRERKDRDG